MAEAGNFSTAAGRLGLSQPALSRTILVGARLFDRGTRNVQLSSVGTELLPITRRLLAEFDSAFGSWLNLLPDSAADLSSLRSHP